MYGDLETKVVLKRTALHGSNEPGVMQVVAFVHVDGKEYRVLAPPESTGDALDWLSHFSIVHDNESGGEVESLDAPSILALKCVEDELKSQKREANKIPGKHPDGFHCDAQICLNGHVQHCDGMPSESKAHCTKCGAACTDECPHCNEPIRGVQLYRPAEEYSRPQYCHGCGQPYPWMDERLRTAHELLRHDDQLTLEERNELWDLLQYVMSDPKADLIPAKKKLIEIKLGKATGYVREAVLDLIARIAVEYMKG